MITIDFETEGIEGNPIWNPPKPVGVSIKLGDAPSVYWAWGHPTGNNCTFLEGKAALLTALEQAGPGTPGWLAHNAPFETSVLRKWFDYTAPDPVLVHDTQYLLFLTEPYAFSFSLKPSAERVLGLPPSEQEEVRDWLLANQPMKHKGITLGTSKEETDTKHFWARYIALAPGDLVGKYAEGDTDRTYLLFQKLYPQVVEQGMLEAYQREQKLMPILSESSLRGVRMDEEKLRVDIKKYRAAQKVSDEYIFSRLGEFDINKDAQLAAALDKAGQITEWVLTPTGKRSVARKNLVGRVRDPEILHHLAYRGVLETCLGTFAEQWLAQAGREGGRVHPQWNQVRGDRGSDGDISGTRTGRMSCRAPNFQNPPNDFESLVIPAGQPAMMQMREYILPEEGHVWVKRDFSAQEMRVMAHFAEGKLFDAFIKDPKTDPHVAVQAIIKELTGIDLPRKYVKITGFGIMYGRGVASTAAALGIPDEEGKRVRDAYFAALPEVRELSTATRRRGSSGQFIRTWGGRVYFREPNAERDLSYKLLNYLIQGSAADQTKQSAIDWEHLRRPEEKLVAMVHDEFNISAPAGTEKDAHYRLSAAMDAPRFDVPFASEGYTGPNWAHLEKHHD
jgi:DNA polymerase I-like protein with 3'-5' exonuclease and polymerase domains